MQTEPTEFCVCVCVISMCIPKQQYSFISQIGSHDAYHFVHAFSRAFCFLFIFHLNSACFFVSLSPARSIPQWIYGLTIQSFIRFSYHWLFFARASLCSWWFFTVHFNGAYVPFCPLIPEHIQHVWHMYWHQWNRYTVFFFSLAQKKKYT